MAEDARHDEHNAAIDELFQSPLTDFTARRNALAKTLKGADAERVRALAKPSVVAWAVNQVFWRARSLYDRLIQSGERLRRAQIAALEGKRADIRTAADAHRRAVADAVAEAERLASAAGSHPAPDSLMRTFEAISLAAEPLQPPGRLSEGLQPAGFEALAGVTPKASPLSPPSGRDRPAGSAPARGGSTAAVGARSPQPVPPVRSAESKSAERARLRQEAAEARRQAAEEKERRDEIRKGEEAVERAKTVESRARAAWERAQEELRGAEQQLAALKELPRERR